MLCPGCGIEVSESAKSCTECGQSLSRRKEKTSGGLSPVFVKVLIVVMVIVLVGGAAYAVFAQPRDNDNEGFDPRGRTWVNMNFEFAGIEMDVPGENWELIYHAGAKLIFRDQLNNTVDIYFANAFAINPDQYRIDNKEHVFNVLSQEHVIIPGLTEDAMYTIAQGVEEGRAVNKHQLFFRRNFTAANKQQQTYTYFITMTISSGQERQYAPTFEHIINSIRLYQF